MVILRSQPTLYNQRFTRYGKSYNFVIIKPQKTKKCIFRALPRVYISQSTHNKSNLSFILKGQTFYDQSFARHEFRVILVLFKSNFGPKMFRLPFSLITWSILKVDPLRILISGYSSDFAITGRSISFLDWSITIDLNNA